MSSNHALIRTQKQCRSQMTDVSPTISVVLCTYNGERYLPSQLASIETQSRTPDELIIRDDASSDSTFSILQDFASETVIPVRLTQNPTRLGVSANFQAAIADATGDYLALCDQDDVWNPEKLHVLARILDAEADIAGAATDARRIDAGGRELPGGTMWQTTRFSPAERRIMNRSREIAPLLRGNVIPGACLMFRASFRDLLLPFSTYSYYDYWISLLLQSVGGLAYVDRPLQSYRLHSENAVGVPSGLTGLRLVRARNMKSAKVDAYRFTEEVLNRLDEKGCILERRSEASLRDWNRYARFRATLPNRLAARAFPVLAAAVRGRYRRHTRNANAVYSRGTVSWLYDLILG